MPRLRAVSDGTIQAIVLRPLTSETDREHVPLVAIELAKNPDRVLELQSREVEERRDSGGKVSGDLGRRIEPARSHVVPHLDGRRPCAGKATGRGGW